MRVKQLNSSLFRLRYLSEDFVSEVSEPMLNFNKDHFDVPDKPMIELEVRYDVIENDILTSTDAT